MKILIITSSLPPSGGAEKVAWDLAVSLSLSCEVSILTFGESNSFTKNENLNIYTIKLRKHNLWYYMTIGRKSILDIIEKIKPDVINSHMFNIITYIVRFNNSKKILTFHNSKFEYYNHSFLQKIKFNFIYKQSFKYYISTTVSKHMQLYLKNYLGKKVHHIPNGINLNQFYKKPEIKINKKNILFIGRIIEFKGVKKIFEASKQLQDFDFYFIGSGPLDNSYFSSNVYFLGKKHPSELVDFYNSSFISVFPSKYENFPLVGLEAMACGSIVLASDIKGFREYIRDGENGFLLKKITSNEIVEKINVIAKFDNLEMVRRNAFKTSENYNLKKIIKMYYSLYNY